MDPVSQNSFPHDEIAKINKEFYIITPEETQSLCDVYRELIDQGQDAEEVKTVVIVWLNYMRDMYHEARKATKDVKMKAEAGVKLAEDLRDPDLEWEEGDTVE